MLPASLQTVFDKKTVVREDGESVPLDSNVSAAEAERLYRVVRDVKPMVTIELGLAQGISATAIAQAHADNGTGGTHYVVDPMQSDVWGNAGLTLLTSSGNIDHVRFFEAYPEEVVTGFPSAQVAFIDASHLFDLTILDFVLVDKRLDVGGILGFHDLWMPSLRKTLRYILSNRHYEPYAEDDAVDPVEGWVSKAHVAIAPVVRKIPGVDRVLRPEVLWPIGDLGVRANMALLRKTADDDRQWQFHRHF